MKLPWLRLGLALLTPACAFAQVTIGSTLVGRPSDDGASQQVYIYVGSTFGTTSTLSSWAFYDDDDFTPNRVVTPLIFEKTNATTYVLRGVGTTRTTTEAGSQTGLSFGLIAGSDAIASNYTFGFTDRALSYPGSGNNVTTGTTNPGVVDRDSGSTWAFTAVLDFNIIIGQSYIVGGSTAGDFSTVELTGTDRIYSATATTAIPEPAVTTVSFALAGLLALTALRRRSDRAAVATA